MTAVNKCRAPKGSAQPRGWFPKRNALAHGQAEVDRGQLRLSWVRPLIRAYTQERLNSPLCRGDSDVTAFSFVGGAPTRPWRENATTATCPAVTWKGCGSALPCRVVLAAIRAGFQRCLDRGQPYWPQQGPLEVVLMAKTIGREAAAECKR